MNIHKKEYVITKDEYDKLVNSLDDANKLNLKLIVENLELQSNILALDEYDKLVNWLNDANKLNLKLVLENLELESNINELVDILKKITVNDYIEQDIYNSWLNKANSIIQKHTKK